MTKAEEQELLKGARPGSPSCPCLPDCPYRTRPKTCEKECEDYQRYLKELAICKKKGKRGVLADGFLSDGNANRASKWHKSGNN